MPSLQRSVLYSDSVSSSPSDRLIACAGPLFAERGFDGVSLSKIARKAGISKATIFHHFPSKEALYLAVIADAALAFRKILESVLCEETSLGDNLKSMMCSHLEHMERRHHITQLVLRELQTRDPVRSRVLVEKAFGANFQLILDRLKRAVEAGQIRPGVSPAMVAMMLLSANVLMFQARTTLTHLPDVDFMDDSKDFASRIVDIVMAGISNDPRVPEPAP